MTRVVRRRQAGAHERKSEATSGRLVHDHELVDERGRFIELEGIREVTDAERTKDTLERIETLHSAVLRAIPDLMFVLHRDGTYLDHHASNPKLLFVPPSAFIGKTVQQVMPPALAEMFVEAITSALGSTEPVIIKYELPISGELRSYEARLVACGGDRVVSIVRDLTDIERAQEQNRNLAGRLIASQEMERRRIARELHDDLSQKVALLNIEIDRLLAERFTVRDRVRCQRRLAAKVGELANDLSQLAHQLHPSKLHTLGLEASIQSICSEFSKWHDISANFAHGSLPGSIDPNVSLCLYRLTQEALHNVFRHSRASHVSVELSSADGALSLQIIDDGVGFDPREAEGTGLGLVSMRERVSLLGGTLQIRSGPQTGTRITAAVPLQKAGRRSRARVPENHGALVAHP